ncbi:MAG: diguanylate cyclase [Desulfobacteraceae bacterium]|nr:diguanylate cyclase [Desulfobacteraceae bacterium]
MMTIRNSVLQCLYEFVNDDEKLIHELDHVIEKEGSQAYSIIFHVLTHLDLEHDKAAECWHEVLAHREIMSTSMGRKINLRTAICDYFCSINKSLKNPKVVELHIFESKANISKYDYLTGLYTRGAFDGSLLREIARSKRHKTETSVLFFDIDDFKRINDTFGHLAGDLVLKKLSRVIIDEIRTEDIAGRYGGEEIVLIFPETGKIKGLVVGERIREKVEQMDFEYEGHPIQVTLSGGLASFPADANNGTNLVKCADDALYKAKSYGKNNIVLYSQDRRRYFRLDFSSEINVAKIGFSDDLTIRATTKNISISGILFESEFALDIGTRLQLSIPIPTFDEPLSIIGIVIRVEFFDSGKYDIGVSFIEMDKSVKCNISQYLINQLKVES